MKFGGTSLSNGDNIRHVCELLHKYLTQKHEIVVVNSALVKVTDSLVTVCQRSLEIEKSYISKFITTLKERHIETCKTAIKDESIQKEIGEIISKTISELEDVLTGITFIKEVTPKIRDFTLSFGERLATPIIYGTLKDLGIKANWFTGGKAGITTDANFGNANPLMDVTEYQLKLNIEKLLEEKITPVITGFIGSDQNGAITTLGRGGSDYTAAILGKSLSADEIWIWSDVDGLMTSDPKIEPNVRTILEISSTEALEMAYFGAKKLHPKAIETVLEKGIPIRIKNTFNPDFAGTLIIRKERIKPHTIVKSISLIPKVAIITLSGASMAGTPGTAATLFKIFGEKNINISMISQSSSEASISLVISRYDLDDALNILETSQLDLKLIREIKTEDNMCIIALVGAGMVGIPGVAARIFNAVAREEINIRMIAQGSSELNISFVIKESQGQKAVGALHKEFGLDKI